MAFDVKVKSSAKIDLFKAIAYYNKINPALSRRFFTEFSGLEALLKTKPHFAIKYKTIRTCKLKSFPYLIHFVVDEKNKLVTIIAVTFGRRLRTDFENRISDI